MRTPWWPVPAARRAEPDRGPAAETPAGSAPAFVVIAVAVVIGALNLWPSYARGADTLANADLAAGLACCAALVMRSRRPVGLALAVTAVSAVSLAAGGAAFVATLTVAVRRSWPVAVGIGALGVLTGMIAVALRPPPGLPYAVSVAIVALLTAATVGWGQAIRARRQLLASLAERAHRAESDRHLREVEARRLERVRIAREMHDVLAHRMSLLSVHAGALEFRPDASPEEISRAAGVIRSGVHQMLVDLREVIGLLREDPVDGADAPPPSLAGVAGLVEESRRAGAQVTLDMDVGDGEAVPTLAGRTAYRVVQEGLTNARKHAPGMPVTVTVRGEAGHGLEVQVHQPLPGPDRGRPAIPGTGTGLTGLSERATLAGGRLEHGPVADAHLLRAWLPWEA
ncbi:histidine kinase [Actinomadura sp. NPDC048032]|uniref:sensor histidine kinase n=1 Tax=Actinomadura sp. NPDC048032 TaxID=3155747 RepID=UPI0033E8FF29